MEHASDFPKTTETGTAKYLRLVLFSDPLLLRDTLAKAIRFLKEQGYTQDECGPVEIVLAEVMNNVIEHAYQGKTDGLIKLTLQRQGDTVNFNLWDEGLPMPSGKVPAGKAHDLNVSLMDLPEGGFGWFLIRELTQELKYFRKNEKNILTFSMTFRSARH